MRAVFMGTPAIAVPSLEALAERFEVALVVCQPDRPAGRGLAHKPPPVKARALELGLPVEQPEKVRTGAFSARLRELDVDFALVIAYGRILPLDVLTAPRRGCLNLHASILPKLRGAAPIAWAIATRERETGVALMQMDEGMDTGPVLATRTLTLDPRETADSLAVRLGALAAEVVRRDLPRALAGELVAEPQDHACATSAPMLDKAHGRIDWSRPAAWVDAHVRAMTSWPGAFTTLGDGRVLKVLEAVPVEPPRLGEAELVGEPGVVLVADKRGAVVACGEGALELVRVQLVGKKPQTGRDLVNGRALAVGARLGGA
jgi:methionyl-tRNA formyltransferase